MNQDNVLNSLPPFAKCFLVVICFVWMGCNNSTDTRKSTFVIEVTYFNGAKDTIRAGACINNHPPTLWDDGSLGCGSRAYANYVRTMKILRAE